MKKLLLLMAAAAVFLALCACGTERAGKDAADASAPATDVLSADPGGETADADDAAAQDGAGETAVSDAADETQTDDGLPDDLVDITESMYVTYINDIYINTADYLGKTIRIQGMFTSGYYEATDTTYYYVYRVGPGCCGNDGSMCGFEFTFDGEYPVDNDWIEVVGVLREYEEEGYKYLTLDALSVTVLDERGLENVYR